MSCYLAKIIDHADEHLNWENKSFIERYRTVTCPGCQHTERVEDETYQYRYYNLFTCRNCGSDIKFDLPVESMPETDENMAWAEALLLSMEDKMYRPLGQIAINSLVKEFLAIVHSKERGEWLAHELRQLDKFPGHMAIRKAYETRYQPADHKYSYEYTAIRRDVQEKNPL